MSQGSRNPIPDILPKLFTLILLGAVVFGGYKGWLLYKEYNIGYKVGHKAGDRFLDTVKSQNLHGHAYVTAKDEFIQENDARPGRPYRDPQGDKHGDGKTWADDLFQQGWHSGFDDALSLWH